MRFILLILALICNIGYAQEVVTKLDDTGRMIINEELRKNRRSVSSNAASIVSIQADIDSKFTNDVLNVANGGTGKTTAPNAINALLPDQSSASGKYLTSNGSVASWGAVTQAFTFVSSTTVNSQTTSVNLTGSDYNMLYVDLNWSGNQGWAIRCNSDSSPNHYQLVGSGTSFNLDELQVVTTGSGQTLRFIMYLYDGVMWGDGFRSDGAYTVLTSFEFVGAYLDPVTSIQFIGDNSGGTYTGSIKLYKIQKS